MLDSQVTHLAPQNTEEPPETGQASPIGVLDGAGEGSRQISLKSLIRNQALAPFPGRVRKRGPNNVGVNRMAVIAQAGHAETKANHTQ